MSLPHAILGFLQVMPMTGYDLKTQAFDRTVAHFWSAMQQQIYRELEKMSEKGWVICQVEHQSDKPSRKVYHITDAGRAELAAWLHQPQPLYRHREGFLVQLFFAAQLSNAEIVQLLEFQLRGHQERLASLQNIYIPPSDDPKHARHQVFSRLTLELGLRMEQMYVAWLTDALQTIRQLPERDESAR